MKDSVRFSSESFRPLLPESSQVNPGRYGAELAWWLAGELVRAGLPTSYPENEDWGWFLEWQAPGGEAFQLCCGNVEGSSEDWLCFVQPVRQGLLAGAPPLRAARPLLDTLARVLDQEPAIHDITWVERDA